VPVGMLTMRRLRAPARHKPGIEQHQRRALWPPPRETTSNIQNRAAGKPLCGRFGPGTDAHNQIQGVTSSRFDYRVRSSRAADAEVAPRLSLPRVRPLPVYLSLA
jgi:hypothetical protein